VISVQWLVFSSFSKINNAKDKSESIKYLILDDNIIVSDESKLIERTLDMNAGGGVVSIALDTTYVSALSLAPKDVFMFIYFNPQKLLKFKSDEKSAANLIGTAADAVKKISGREVEIPEQRMSTGKTDILSDEKPDVEEVNRLLKFIPENAVFSYVDGYIDPEKYWAYISKVRASKEAIKGIEVNTELDIHTDIVSKFGSKVVYFYSGIQKDESYFFPANAFGVELRDGGNIEPNVKKIFDYLFSAREAMKYREYMDVRVNYIDNPGAFSPNFSVLDDYLFFSFDTSTMEALIDAYKGNSVLDSDIFKTFRERASGDGEITMFLNGELFFTTLKLYITTLANESSKFDTRDIDMKVKPLFDVLKKSVNAIGKLDRVDGELRGEVRIVFDNK